MVERGGDDRMISVDRWTGSSQVYFLTHLHSDHTKGLSSNWTRGPLFCSPESAKLFTSKFPGFNVSLLRVLEIGKTHAIPLVSLTTGNHVVVEVTPIDSCHCPGSVMYLFRGEFGCVLHTGDYRWEATCPRAQLAKNSLLSALGGDKVDMLYLDNTYCHPSFMFPPRTMAAQQVVDIITSHSDHDILLGINTLGKEDLLLSVSQSLGTKIWVWPERLQTMHLLGITNTFTTSTRLTRVRAVPRYSLTIETLEKLNTVHPTIGIMPSGLPWTMNSFGKCDASQSRISDIAAGNFKANGDFKGFLQKYHQYAYAVPYSDHSCFNEIAELVKLVRPSKIVGIVSSSFCYVNPLQYFSHSPVGNAVVPNDSCLGSKRSELGKRLRFIQTESVPGCETSENKKVKKERMAKISRFVVRRSRVTLLRQNRRGTKLKDSDVLHGSSDCTLHKFANNDHSLHISSNSCNEIKYK